MEAEGRVPMLPSVAHRHLINWWLEIGPTASGSMGEGPLGWQEMLAWQGIKGIELGPWEALAIRSMSQAYLSQRHESRKSDCPPPYSGERDQIVSQRDEVAHRIKSAFKGLVGKKG